MNYNEALNLFGFTGSFTEESLRKKYLELSKKYHPDMGGSDEMMKKVNAAYVALKGKSTNYDLTYFDSLKEKLQNLLQQGCRQGFQVRQAPRVQLTRYRSRHIP